MLSYFLAVAEEGNISRAAAKLHISQPSLSKYIMSLESEIGENLFLREARSVSLTERGVLFRERVQGLITIAEQLETEFVNSKNPMEANVYVGAGYPSAIQVISRAAERIYEQYPKIRYHFFNGEMKNILDRVSEGLLDFALTDLPDDEKYDYKVLPIKATWGLLVRNDCPVVAKDIAEPEDILNARIIFTGQTYVSDKLSKWLHTDFKKLNIIATFDLMYGALIFVSEGFGCAICSDQDLKLATGTGLCFRPFSPEISSHYCIVRKKGQKISKAAELLINTIEDVIKEGL